MNLLKPIAFSLITLLAGYSHANTNSLDSIRELENSIINTFLSSHNFDTPTMCISNGKKAMIPNGFVAISAFGTTPLAAKKVVKNNLMIVEVKQQSESGEGGSQETFTASYLVEESTLKLLEYRKIGVETFKSRAAQKINIVCKY